MLVTESLCRGGRPWLEVATEAIAGGADCIQLREKSLQDGELLARAKSLVQAVGGRAAVIVNDRADIALAAGATGVHLGQEDAPVSAVRELAGDRLLVGVSTHDLIEARRAMHDGADYVGVGAMFPTSTKVRETSGPAYLRAFLEFTRETRPLPHVAIGGITPENVANLIEAGCRGVAVSGVVCASMDPAGVCTALRSALP
ncbi:MAG: thiamine phosphate synthase [Phycisphaerales bacterium]